MLFNSEPTAAIQIKPQVNGRHHLTPLPCPHPNPSRQSMSCPGPSFCPSGVQCYDGERCIHLPGDRFQLHLAPAPKLILCYNCPPPPLGSRATKFLLFCIQAGRQEAFYASVGWDGSRYTPSNKSSVKVTLTLTGKVILVILLKNRQVLGSAAKWALVQF